MRTMSPKISRLKPGAWKRWARTRDKSPSAGTMAPALSTIMRAFSTQSSAIDPPIKTKSYVIDFYVPVN